MHPISLDPATCYRAIRSRDRRFEGRFVVAVLSTGIYCRPGCPARTPRRENTRFFPGPAAAEAAGFRACRRCRPDRSPETPVANGTAATVHRALRLLEQDGAAADLDRFAERLGIGARHLRRLFVEHLGASPAQVLRTRRLHLARQLVEESSLPLGEVAFAAHFGSVRRFNDAFQKAFGERPSDARARRTHASSTRTGNPNGTTGLALRLAFKPPFSWDATLGFLGPREIPFVESIDGGVYRRAVLLDGTPAAIEVRLAGDARALEVRVGEAHTRALPQFAHRVRRMFDLAADPLRIAEHLGEDPVLEPLVRRYPGIRIPAAWDPFELGVRAILGQQVSVRGATTLIARLVSRFGHALPAPVAPALTHLFPAPEVLAEADVASIGLPKQRGAAVRAFAAAVARGAVSLEGEAPLEALVEQLSELPGIGAWTAQYIALRALSEPDAFPGSDLGLCHATGLTPKALAERAESWRPWRGYAAMLIWTDLVLRKGGNLGRRSAHPERRPGEAGP